jgi:hypothetical protein
MIMFNRFVGAYTGTKLDQVSDFLTYSNNLVWGGRGGFPKNLVTQVSLKKLIKYLLTIILIVNSQIAFAKTPTTIYKQFAFVELNHSFEQFYCLDKLYFHESRWNPLARNGSHHGIPQGRSEWLKGVTGTTQVLWGIKYIKNRYGVDKAGIPNACAALTHWSKKGWH